MFDLFGFYALAIIWLEKRSLRENSAEIVYVLLEGSEGPIRLA